MQDNENTNEKDTRSIVENESSETLASSEAEPGESKQKADLDKNSASEDGAEGAMSDQEIAEQEALDEAEMRAAAYSEEEKAERIRVLVPIIEGALMAAGQSLTLTKLQSLFDDSDIPSKGLLTETLASIQEGYVGRGFELIEVASGWRFQVREAYAPWVNRLWQEKPQKYSRALMETLALVAYRQPITRGDIEEVRGVAVSSHIMKTLTEREWVKVVGHRDVPGRPALYATTKQFLDYFNMKSLDELPTLGEIKDIDGLNQNLEFESSRSSEQALNTDDNSVGQSADQSTDQSTDQSAVDETVADEAGEEVNVEDAERGDDASAESADTTENIDSTEAEPTETELHEDEPPMDGESGESSKSLFDA